MHGTVIELKHSPAHSKSFVFKASSAGNDRVKICRCARAALASPAAISPASIAPAVAAIATPCAPRPLAPVRVPRHRLLCDEPCRGHQRAKARLTAPVWVSARTLTSPIGGSMHRTWCSAWRPARELRSPAGPSASAAGTLSRLTLLQSASTASQCCTWLPVPRPDASCLMLGGRGSARRLRGLRHAATLSLLSLPG